MALRRGLIDRQILELDLKDLEAKHDPQSRLEYQKKCCSLEELDLALLGTLREFDALYAIFMAFPEYAHEQLQEAEVRYWQLRLQRQAEQDLTAHGRISVGNLDAIRQLSTPIGPDHCSQHIDAPTADVQSVFGPPISSETHNPIPDSFLDENAQNAPGRTISG